MSDEGATPRPLTVLFLCFSTREGDSRDNITYTFVEKEMRALARTGTRVFFLGNRLDDDREIGGVHYLSRARRLESSRLGRALGLMRYIVRNATFFASLAKGDPRHALRVAVHERSIDRVASEIGADVLHTHFLYPLGECGVLTARRHRIPVIATLRGAELRNEPELGYGSMRKPAFRRTANLCLPKVNRVTAPNGALVEELIERFDLPAGQVERLANGIDTSVAPRTAGRRRSGPLRLLAVGRLVALKNHEPIVRQVVAMGPERAHLRIVGHGPVADVLQALVPDDASANVEIMEEVSKETLFDLMRDADALIHPSLLEGLPNVVLESLALGVPCLLSDIAPHREIIDEGVEGYFFDPNSSEAIAAMLERVASNPDDLGRMRDACISRSQKFSITDKISRYLEIYNECLMR